MEYDVSGQMTVRLKSTENNAKLFKFARTFTATKMNFLGDFMEVNPFADLKMADKDDKIIVDVSFIVEQRQIMHSFNEDLIMIKVNENYVEVDKFLLASNSEYFKSVFFGNRFPGTKHEFQLPESVTVEDFKQLLEILTEKSAVNDNSIQGTFILANFFAFQKLETNCRKFLIENSAKSIVFKYKLADACNLTLLRDNILANMTAEDVYNKETFIEECLQLLDKRAIAAFKARLKKLKIQIRLKPMDQK